MLGAPIDKGFNRLAWLLPWSVGGGAAAAVGLRRGPLVAQARRRAGADAARATDPDSTSASTMSSETSTERPAEAGARDRAPKPDARCASALAVLRARGARLRDGGHVPGPQPGRHPRSFCCRVLMATTALVGLAALRAVRPLVSPHDDRTAVVGQRTRAALEQEKALALRTIKELEFDRAMGKISDDDFHEMSVAAARPRDAPDEAARRRRRLPDADRARSGEAPGRGRREACRAPARACAKCSTANDPDARFCKTCGSRL